MSHNRSRGAPNGPRRGQTQRIASGARAAPYARPEASRMASAGSWSEDASVSRQWPPNQISIRGRSGPTWIVVANLLRGTSEADIHETFRQFGEIEEVKMRRPPSENHPSIAFEIAFTLRDAAKVAIEKLDNALADGRVLQVGYRDPPPSAPVTSSPAIQTPPSAPAAQREPLSPAIPTGPRGQARNNTGRELLQSKGKQPTTQQKAAATSLQSRLMSAAELKSLQRQQAKAAPVRKVMPGVPIGPKGMVGKPALTASMPLSKRITLPLAMRLSAEAKKGGPASSQASSTAKKAKSRKARVKAKSANGMDVD